MRIQVLQELGGGSFGTIYKCRGFVCDTYGVLLPVGNVVVKVPNEAEVTKGVSVVCPGVLKSSWPDWQGAFEGQHCSNVAGAHAVGMCAAVMRAPESGADWPLYAARQAVNSMAAAVSRAKAKLGDVAVESIVAAAPPGGCNGVIHSSTAVVAVHAHACWAFFLIK
jgi:hypothetical protein